MKKIIITAAVVALMLCTVFTMCACDKDKVDNDVSNAVTDASQRVSEAVTDISEMVSERVSEMMPEVSDGTIPDTTVADNIAR